VVLQRVSRGAVTVYDNESPRGRETGHIQKGLVVLVGMTASDTIENASRLAAKMLELRIFEDDAGKMNRSVQDIRGGILVVSQFTLYADTRKGRRPSFTDAMPPAEAEALYDRFIDLLTGSGLEIASGEFGAKMKVDIENDGPVTIILEDAPAKPA